MNTNEKDYYDEATEREWEQRKLRESLTEPVQELTPELTGAESTALKVEINEIVWRNASNKTTLEEADKIASDFWAAIMRTH